MGSLKFMKLSFSLLLQYNCSPNACQAMCLVSYINISVKHHFEIVCCLLVTVASVQNSILKTSVHTFSVNNFIGVKDCKLIYLLKVKYSSGGNHKVIIICYVIVHTNDVYFLGMLIYTSGMRSQQELPLMS